MFELKPVTGKKFVDREYILKRIIGDLKIKDSPVSFGLYGKRRAGKTSIIKEIERKLKYDKNLVPIYFSVWDLTTGSLNEFADTLFKHIYNAYKKKLSTSYKFSELLKSSGKILKDVLNKIGFSIKLQDEIGFLLRYYREDKEINEKIDRTLELPEILAEETSCKAVLFIDEFPSILDFRNSSGEWFLRKFRTKFENYKHTAICISGSVQHTMNIVALEPGSPFYRQLEMIEVKPFDKETVKRFFKHYKIGITSEGATKVFSLTGGFPFYLQVLGREFERRNILKIQVDDLDKIFQDLIDQELELILHPYYNKLSDGEKTIVNSMAKGYSSPNEIAKNIGKPINYVSRYLLLLQEKAVVEKIERGKYQLTDPVFSEWLNYKNYNSLD